MSGGVNYTTLSPQIKQVFFIGDGRTSTGAVQQIVIPGGATRLFLATMDSTAWNKHSGSFAVSVTPFDPANGPSPLTLSTVFTSNAFHVDYYEPDNSVIAMGVTFPFENFEEVKSDGSHAPFSKFMPGDNPSGENNMAIARSTDPGGFRAGDMFYVQIFSGGFGASQIVKLTNGGQTIIDPWVILPPGYQGDAIVAFDRTGVFGGDLLVEFNSGEIGRINADGHYTEIASGVPTLESMEVIPNDPTRYGPLAGTILGAAAEGTTADFYTISATGQVTRYNFGIFGGNLDDARVIPPNQNFLGAFSSLYGIPYQQLAPLVGDILLDSEWNGLFRMYWDGKALQVQPLDFGPGSISLQYGFEGSQFVPAGINSLPAVPQDSGARAGRSTST